ncbi:coiled-coil domain-containing protein 111 [Thecamonas trahens ATCC 50062]|uniref:DNA-directed primase/polymerase protein n=1 Tax=Thecamonas trahens ATCC 50062 TaxID=461836 RepID=A0A0L0DHA7_THETB|nr:coiled-coil domain-containing protein 111 [Thecamonas trahens ATCC 50062]KNC51697.1 coiled-coil domain-containing protein 111 [Thecamonas trahens ATCC 50062]|eukprot:XP_013755826.1 coiled-coil domain-containing protein 111 [Thecamonas trahens ATCC 50062]
MACLTIFRKQAQALDDALGKPGAMVVAAEIKGAGNGARWFATAHLDAFWREYAELPLDERVFYEVIPPHAVCRLYIDLEFATAANPEVDGEARVARLLRALMRELSKVFRLPTPLSIAHALVLDSSTPAKFSQHVIVHVPGRAFQDVYSVGKFMTTFVARLRARATRAGRSSCVDVAAKDGSPGCLVDLGVYTKNRNFRLYKSSKAGRRAPLVVARTSRFPITSEARLFRDSLVSASIDGADSMTILRCGNRQSVARPRLSLAPVEAERIEAGGSRVCGEHTPAAALFPAVFRHLEDVISPGGRIRTWFYIARSQRIVCEIAGSWKYCHNVKRHHASNNVMLIADLAHGGYYQKCHDPECAAIGFRSNLIPFPLDVLLTLPQFNSGFVDAVIAPHVARIYDRARPGTDGGAGPNSAHPSTRAAEIESSLALLATELDRLDGAGVSADIQS